MTSILTRLEINVLSADANYSEATQWSSKNKCNAIVVLPQMATMILSDKFAKGGKYKVISAVDFPHGKTFGFDKIKRMNPNGLNVDGFDVLITPGKTQIDSSNEIKAVVGFIRSLNAVAEVRIVVGCYSRKWEDVVGNLKDAEKNAVTAIRIDQHLMMSGIDVAKHIEMIKKIRQHTARPLIISGNVDFKTINDVVEVDKNVYFDVTVAQAKAILNAGKPTLVANKDGKNEA